MSRKSKIEVTKMQPRRVMRPVYQIINPTGTVPVARPASNIQLTPIVQPVSFVPYSTQAQPMLTDESDYDY